MEMQEEKKKAGVRPWKEDLARSEYERIFLVDLPRGNDYLKRMKLLATCIALKEIRNCYSKNQDGEYILAAHNIERQQRILEGIDTLVNGWVNNVLGNPSAQANTNCDRLIVGELGTTWRS